MPGVPALAADWVRGQPTLGAVTCSLAVRASPVSGQARASRGQDLLAFHCPSLSISSPRRAQSRTLAHRWDKPTQVPVVSVSSVAVFTPIGSNSAVFESPSTARCPGNTPGRSGQDVGHRAEMFPLGSGFGLGGVIGGPTRHVRLAVQHLHDLAPGVVTLIHLQAGSHEHQVCDSDLGALIAAPLLDPFRCFAVREGVDYGRFDVQPTSWNFLYASIAATVLVIDQPCRASLG